MKDNLSATQSTRKTDNENIYPWLSYFINIILNQAKKALKIIFQYHKSEKLILFVGFPYKIERRINNLSRHVSIPYSFNVQGFIPNMDTKLINKNKYLKYTLLRSYDKFLLPK